MVNYRDLLKCGKDIVWEKLYRDPELQKYVIMEQSPCGRVIVLGYITGHLLIMSPNGLFSVILLGRAWKFERQVGSLTHIA